MLRSGRPDKTSLPDCEEWFRGKKEERYPDRHNTKVRSLNIWKLGDRVLVRNLS